MKQQSKYLENAKFRIENKTWLNYSRNIAIRIISALEDNENMSQKTLAEKLEVSPQYISKILKGQENLSLSTIAKISTVLGVDLISFPYFKYNEPIDNSDKLKSNEMMVAEGQFDFISYNIISDKQYKVKTHEK